ncbi:MAG TPA: AAA family ATPase [Elusimicrobiales bacterium]|nr:AAA family ATPase [Elusimicrobiales bacterium]HOL62145.1 AAA family ATPase [Elusimicrobiales bacterium]HPO95976.1 AAA family ATPase [Elusimicrobiales bacterium]
MENMEISKLSEKVKEESLFIADVKREIAKVISGQEELVNSLIVALLANGHVLVEGLPGLAKTTTIKTLSDTIKAQYQRIQFTPDLLPADITGTLIYHQGSGNFMIKKGPVFANIILADEINRAPAKVQSALLEAMQERQVTIGDSTYKLPDPFLVMATQNPIEQEGTYPLPEAQVDRFMLKVNITYPSKEEEVKIIDIITTGNIPKPNQIIEISKIVSARNLVNMIYVDDKIKSYVVDIVNTTRFPEKYKLESIKNWIRYGASPRATIFLIQAAKAYAFIQQRAYITPQDIKAVGFDVLRHRIMLSYEAEAEEITSETVIKTIFETIDVP